MVATKHGIESQKKYGEDWHYKGAKSGDIVRYNPIRVRMYWQNESVSEPPKRKLTEMKKYTVEYAYSAMIQVKCDTGRIVSYESVDFEILKKNENWERL